MSNAIEIDGSHGEGGGQIIRTAVSLSALTGRPVQIDNVRARRTKPGLQPQHLAAVRAAASLCNARLAGDTVGSNFLWFEPQSPVAAGDYNFEIGTAGAAPLVFQTVLVPLSQAGGTSRVRVTGGTHVPHAPTADYLETVYLPILHRMGIEATITSHSAGFYPKGGGIIEVEIRGGPAPQALDLRKRGKLQSLRASVLTSNLPAHVAERGASTIQKSLRAIGRNVEIARHEKPSLGPGAAVILTAACQNGLAGFASVGELRKPMEKVAEAPCREFLRWWKSDTSCDEHLADQLVLPLSLAAGPSTWSTPIITNHLRTVLSVVEAFLPVEWALTENPGGSGQIHLQVAPAP